MAMSEKLAELLRVSHVPHQTIHHPVAYTAQATAKAGHVPSGRMAKVVCLRDDEGDWLMAVIPASMRLDLDALQLLSHRRALRIASEGELRQRFPDCETGAIPPFALLHQVPVYMDDDFDDDADVFVEDGTHDGLVGMKVPDYIRLATPIVGHIAHQGH
jgi:Ala-tRNA(Pro) deacylase